ncbi:MAG: TonB-dependent receptor [Proteobacteria bacterium]|nr:TonB-dependent receptor [Pseudomonadota bacterium]
MIRLQRACLPLIWVLASSPAAASDSLDDLLGLDLEQLMEVEVLTASRRLERQEDAPASVEVITRDMIVERGYLTIADALRDLPGFDVSTGYPSGEYPTHFLFRGQGDVGQTKMLVLVDNIEANEVSNGWVNQIGWEGHLTDVERIEVIAGPGSALYGGHAYSGIIHIITRSPADELAEDTAIRARAAVHAGTYKTLIPSLSLTGRLPGGAAVRLSGRFVTSQGDHGLNRSDPGGYFTGNYEPEEVLTLQHGVIPNETVAGGGTRAIEDGFDTSVRDVSARLRVEDGGLGISAWYWRRDEGLGSEVVGYEYFANTDDQPFRAVHTGYGLSVSHTAPFGPRAERTFKAAMRGTEILPSTAFVYTYQYQAVDNGTDSPTRDLTKNYHGVGYELSIDPQANWRISEKKGSENTLTAGFEVQRRVREYFAIGLGNAQGTDSTIVDSSFPTGAPSVNPVFFSWNGGAYVQDSQQLGPHSLVVGIRADLDTTTNPALNPRAGLVLHPHQDWTIKLLYGEAFKAPTIFELRDEWRGNPLLTSQKIRTAEAELRARLLDRRLFARASVYTSWTHDLIEVAPNPDTDAVPIGPLGQLAEYYQNRGSGRFHGVSADVRGEPIEGLTLYANYALNLNEELKPIDGVASHKVNLGGTWHAFDLATLHMGANIYGPVKAPASNRYYQPKDDDWVADNYDYVTEEDPDGFGPGHVLVNATLSSKSLSVGRVSLAPQFIVRNLFDAKVLGMGRQSGSGTRPVDQPSVRNPDGFVPAYHPLPGRELMLGLRGEFR